MDLSKYKKTLNKVLVSKSTLEKNITQIQDKLSGLEEDVEGLKDAREIVNNVMCLTQNEVKGFIEEVVSLALSSVFGKGFSFEIEYSIKRNQSEAVLWIIEDGIRNKPDFDVGGGVNDVASFALRLAFYALLDKKPSPIFVLDEPSKHLSSDKQILFGQMLNEISELLGVQILIVSHSPDIVDVVDKSYRIIKEKGISRVEEV